MRNMITKAWCLGDGNWQERGTGYLGECDGSIGSGLFPIRGEWFRISPGASALGIPLYLSISDMASEDTETPARGAP